MAHIIRIGWSPRCRRLPQSVDQRCASVPAQNHLDHIRLLGFEEGHHRHLATALRATSNVRLLPPRTIRMLAAPSAGLLVAGKIDQGAVTAELEGTVPQNRWFLASRSPQLKSYQHIRVWCPKYPSIENNVKRVITPIFDTT
ncbi:MAG: hypothetical protein JXB62_01780 [Pirellulales bacterium]|nr:hypothetical protein [Pirellulales bacterium]